LRHRRGADRAGAVNRDVGVPERREQRVGQRGVDVSDRRPARRVKTIAMAEGRQLPWPKGGNHAILADHAADHSGGGDDAVMTWLLSSLRKEPSALE
jgi:hypothetical protein